MKKRYMYCVNCGKQLKEIELDIYDKYTGKKIKDFENCDIKDCIHGFHKYSGIIYRKCKLCGSPEKGLL